MKILSTQVPHWFPEIKPLVVMMAGSGIRPVISKVTSKAIKLRYQSREAYQDADIMRRLYNIIKRHGLNLVWSSTVNGLYLTISEIEKLGELE